MTGLLALCVNTEETEAGGWLQNFASNKLIQPGVMVEQACNIWEVDTDVNERRDDSFNLLEHSAV